MNSNDGNERGKTQTFYEKTLMSWKRFQISGEENEFVWKPTVEGSN